MLPSDFLGLICVEDPQIAPDASAIVYVRARQNLAENRTERSLWRARDGKLEAFTQGIADRAPRWSPNGRAIAFLRTDPEKKTHLFAIPADGGEPREVAGPFGRCGAPAWSPDGSRIAFAAAALPDSADASLVFDEPSGARHILRLPYKSDALGLFDGKRMQIHVAQLDGPVRVVAKGAFEAGTPAWSPDGKRLAFGANPGVVEGSFANDVYAVDADGDGTLQRLTAMNGLFGTPAFSRDGNELAVLGNDTDEFAGRRNQQLWCIPLRGGAPRSLTPARRLYLGDGIIADLRVHENANPYWSPGDREIVVQRSQEGVCELIAYARDGSSERRITGADSEIYAFSGARDGTLAFAATTLGDPGSLHVVAPDGALSHLPNENAEWLAAHPPVVPERSRPHAADGTELDLWLLRANPDAALVHAIHGGPHGAYGCAYFFEFQLLAAMGLSVAYGNPRGSQTYGEAYADAITGRWGELDAADLLTMREAAVRAGGFDRSRIGVEGGSYGGLMTTWLLGHDRGYRCGVSMRAVNDYVSFAGASDIPNFIERELAASWEDDGGRRLFELSPIRAAAAIEAPLLIVHSDRDLRCPIDQGEQLFQRLRLLGKTAEFVRFTGDGHDLSRSGSPRNRLLRYRALAHWLRAHLGVEDPKRDAGWLFAPYEGEPEAAT